ncbi:SgcJ/EcaC family oxidoreductase [Nocardia sp. KC 131]|uniref:SgcJ/EcaC family oxidoreductase n=1 Tax=Nocardia arseniciresistens TaxID=3392119 RepID=UPI00398F0142
MNNADRELIATAAIHTLVAEAVKFQNDPEQFVPLHTASVNIVNFGGRRVSGIGALSKAMQAALASPLADVLTEIEIDDIHFVRDDVAIVACVKHVFDGREDARGNLPASSGRLTYVVVEKDGRWLIESAQTTPILSS